MKNPENLYKRHRFPPEIIQYAVWLYHRFNVSHRDIEDLLAEKGIMVSYESIRLWCNKFGSKYARRLQRQHQGCGGSSQYGRLSGFWSLMQLYTIFSIWVVI
jgi:transposase-like protein